MKEGRIEPLLFKNRKYISRNALAIFMPNMVTDHWTLSTQGFIIDLDGTLIRGERATPGAGELLSRLADRYIIVSNNSSETPEELAGRLHHYGLETEADRLVLAGEMTLQRLSAQHLKSRILLLASASMQRRAKELGLKLVDDAPDFVVLARDESFSYAKLRNAANALRAGARLIATNPDASHPDTETDIIPETGALLRSLVECAGTEPIEIIGKPHPTLFLEALRRLQTLPKDTVVIGDNLATDAAGAVALNMRFLLLGDSLRAVAASPAELLAYGGAAISRMPN